MQTTESRSSEDEKQQKNDKRIRSLLGENEPHKR